MRGGRPLQAWTYVGAYGPELMLCAASARDRRRSRSPGGRCGTATARPPAPQGHARRDRHRATRPRRGRSAAFELALGDGAPVEVVVPARAPVRVDAQARRRRGARRTELGDARGRAARDRRRVRRLPRPPHGWRWSAGVGVGGVRRAASPGTSSTGIHDAPAGVRAHRVGRRRAARGRRRSRSPTTCRRVGDLRFTPEAVRAAAREPDSSCARTTSSRSARSPASCPVAGPLREGWGVMERHEVYW